MSSCDASRIAQCNLGLFDSFRLLSIKNGLGFPRMVWDVTCFRFDLIMMNLLLQEKIMPFFDEFNSSELNWTKSRYSFSSEKLVIFENDPLSIHWRTAWKNLSKTVKLFNESMQNWLLRIWYKYIFISSFCFP